MNKQRYVCLLVEYYTAKEIKKIGMHIGWFPRYTTEYQIKVPRPVCVLIFKSKDRKVP